MEGANRGDEGRNQINNCPSPSAFLGVGPFTASTQFNTGNEANVRNMMKENPNFDVNVSANEMYKMAQNTLAANLEFKGSPMLSPSYLSYLEKFNTEQAMIASKYPDSGIENPQSSASWFPDFESDQNPTVGYGGMANEKYAFLIDQQVARRYPELSATGSLDNHSVGWIDAEAALDYVNAVKTDAALANDVDKYVRKPSEQEMANYYQAVNADRAKLVNYQKLQADQTDAFKSVGFKPGFASALAGDYLQVKPGGGSIAPSFSEHEGGPTVLGTPIPGSQNQLHTLALPAGIRGDLWPKPLEDFLMALKSAGYTFPDISAKMVEKFGIERSPNVLSKRYRLILARDAEDSGIMQLMKSATPKILRVLQEEMEKMDPEIMNEELRREVWEELQRKLPKAVRTLALQTRPGA